MKPKYVKELLISEIKTISKSPQDYCINPKSDFSRNRKLPFERILTGIIGMGGGSLSNELVDMFNCSADVASSSAFVQQRSKIKLEAFESIFKSFSQNISKDFNKDMRILAVDGSDIHIATNPDDKDSYFPRKNGANPYNLLHLNALYDLKNGIYQDAILQKARVRNEHKALVDMVDRSSIPSAVIIADRGYESYNNMAHIQEKGWKFLIRIKDGNVGIKSSLILPETDSFDMDVNLNLTRKQTNETKLLFQDKNNYKYVASSQTFDYLPLKNKKNEPVKFYKLSFRIIRFHISKDTFETVLTNLDKDMYPLEKIKELYASRWGIETSFRALKYTVGMLNFHAKKVMLIQQEIYARMIMYNFAQMITSHVVIEKKQRKYTYKANFSVAVHMCRLFYKGKATPTDLEAIIVKNLIPIRPDRHRQRKLKVKGFRGFLYRVS